MREGGVLFVTVNQFINYVAFNPTPHRSGSSMEDACWRNTLSLFAGS